jgi:hypothetical protein
LAEIPPVRKRAPRDLGVEAVYDRDSASDVGSSSGPLPANGEEGKIGMARKGRTAILKRQREVKKAERAAMKREKRESRKEAEPDPDTVATAEDLAGYGFGPLDDKKGDKDAGRGGD